MLGLFGYMDFLIFRKWATYYENTNNAPDIKSTLMDIFLNPQKKIEYPLWGTESQMHSFHYTILIGSVICIILMLFPKAFIDHCKAQRKYALYVNKIGLNRRPNPNPSTGDENNKESLIQDNKVGDNWDISIIKVDNGIISLYTENNGKVWESTSNGLNLISQRK